MGIEPTSKARDTSILRFWGESCSRSAFHARLARTREPIAAGAVGNAIHATANLFPGRFRTPPRGSLQPPYNARLRQLN